jgi:hypothetical protein
MVMHMVHTACYPDSLYYNGFRLRMLGVRVVDVRRLDGLLASPPEISVESRPAVVGAFPPTNDIRRFETFCIVYDTNTRSASECFFALSGLTCSLRLGAA